MKTITVGRYPTCDIIIEDYDVSRVHAEVSRYEDKFLYKDTSKNGSLINGKLCKCESVIVEAGTEILLSGRVKLPWIQVYMLLPK